MATLLYIITEGTQGGPFELTDGTHILGSAGDATILVPDSTISAQHGQFDVGNGQIVYQDLGSQNGSFVSEQPIAQAQPVALSAGHILQAGSIHFQLVNDPNAVESMKRETAVISNTPKAIEPGDFGSADPSASPFKTRNSGWVKIYIIVITVIGIVAIGALVMTLLQG